ncbi:hypothetical protein J8J27_26935, partial [Mycobacterium tuberculosis]|nr:hypothetical protein [Mycobacterium tuberculosis]
GPDWSEAEIAAAPAADDVDAAAGAGSFDGLGTAFEDADWCPTDEAVPPAVAASRLPDAA